MLITSNALYSGIIAEIHIINRCITPVANSLFVEKMALDHTIKNSKSQIVICFLSTDK
jgi:hypothetical protein